MKLERIPTDRLVEPAICHTHPCIIQSATTGYRYCAYRVERAPLNQRSWTWICSCDEYWHPLNGGVTVKVEVDRNRERLRIAEDCRLFHFDRSIWLSVTNREHIYLARTFEVGGRLVTDSEDSDILAFPFEVGAVEKNWTFFEHAGELYGIRWVHQHTVHKIDVNEHGGGHAVWPAEATNWHLAWLFGRPSGGTCPILVGDHYLSVFHSSCQTDTHATGKTYFAGVYMFEAKPPFRVTHGPSKPLLDATTRVPGFNGHKVVFPLGIVRSSQGQWDVSFGDDSAMYVASYTIDELLDHTKAL
jgi:hypothetical protein